MGLDIAKGIAVLLMICMHVQEVFSHSIARHSSFGSIVESATGFPAAPLLMFVMDVGAVYSRRQDARHALGRGATLPMAGYLLNAERGFIPWSIGIRLRRMAKDVVPYGDIVQGLIEVDILHLAGLCFIFIGILRAAEVPRASASRRPLYS